MGVGNERSTALNDGDGQTKFGKERRMGKHTPLPWRISSTPNSPRIRPMQIKKYFGISPEGGPAFIILPKGREDIQEANAELIINAVNSHDDLLEALEEVSGCEGCRDAELGYCPRCETSIRRKAIIAEAKGETS